jgi:nitrite reductase (NO-forming)
VAARVPGQLHERDHGRGGRAARLAQALVRLLDPPQHPDALFLAWLVAVIETLIALALIAGFARKTAYAVDPAAIVFSLLIWATAEGFGGPYTSGASDIGTAIIYPVVFAALLALSYYSGPGRLSADRYLGPDTSGSPVLACGAVPGLAGDGAHRGRP